MSPKHAMMERRRRTSGEAEDDEVEVLRGGGTKALEDQSQEDREKMMREKEGQRAIEEQMPERQRHGDFLGTPRPALEEGKTPRGKMEETPARAQEEWKTPKEQLREAPTGARSSAEGQGAQETHRSVVKPEDGKERMDQRDPKWPGGPHTEPRPLRPPPGSQPEEGSRRSASQPVEPLFNTEQMRRYEELRRQAPMLNPGGRDDETLQAMRPKELAHEELRRLQANEAKLMKEQEELKAEAKLLRRMLAIRDEEERLRREREEMINPPGLQEEEYQTPEDLKDPAKKLFQDTEETAKPKGPKEDDRPPREEAARPPKPTKEAEDPHKASSSSSTQDPQTAAMMQGMMKLMEGMQMMQSQILDVKKQKDVEVVKSSVSELPRLPEWRAETAPLDLTDWFLTIEPAMGDLSDGSQQWWDGMVQAAKKRYALHQEKTPLEKVNHPPTAPAKLREAKYQRLEKRATALLMAAIPKTQQEEVIAGKDVSTMGILGRLMLSYQPGGLSEKAAILTALDSPEEAQGLQQAVGGLRRWLRWHRRAGEVGVVRPDATLQVKGLGRLMKKVLRDNADLAFRIQLAKSSLQIDTTPTEASFMTFANHLLAEVEQIAHQDRKKKEEKPAVGEVKLKKFEDGGGGGKGEGKAGRGERAPCRFYGSEDGCRKGKSCSWSHVIEDKKDDRRRCWTCGSTKHYAPQCDRPKEASPDKAGKPVEQGTKVAMRAAKKEKDDSAATAAGSADPTTPTPKHSKDEDDSQAMKGLLEEANKMLKAIQQGKTEEDEGKEVRLQKLQRQLDELKTLKVFRIAKVHAEAGDYGLLDSGATHALRGRRRGESLKDMAEVKVTLACGRDAALRMNQWGTMINQHEETEPIVPLGKLVNQLGCSVGWSEEGLEVVHPEKGRLATTQRGGCPHIPREVALDIIQELEERAGKIKKVRTKEEDEEAWLRKLVEVHPVFKDLPQDVKRELVVTPSKDLTALPGMNRRRRRKIQKEGATVHLFAGEDDGYTVIHPESSGEGCRRGRSDSGRAGCEKRRGP
eukprot:s194_g51.t1